VSRDRRSQRFGQPAGLGGKGIAEAFENGRQEQQIGALHEAPDPRAEDVPATGQGRAIDRAPELPVQPGDLPYREPCPPGRDARDLDRLLQVAQIFEHQDESVRSFVEIAVQESRGTDARMPRQAAVVQALALMHPHPPREPERPPVRGRQLDDDGSGVRGDPAVGGQVTAQEPPEGIGGRPEVLDDDVPYRRLAGCTARGQGPLQPVRVNRGRVVAEGRMARHCRFLPGRQRPQPR